MARGAALALVAIAALSGCRGGPSRPPTATCREIGVAGERWLATTAEANRADVLAFAAELIDQCQRPGLPPATKACVGGAPDPATARACPGVTAVHRGAIPPLPSHGGGDDDDRDDDDDDGDLEGVLDEPF
ncbi:MAG: hypothetical protein KBG48_06770 [Kofleriaceae bacterium]|jgi:hypothetical protein|nr:hypothetical protein [Kofleriaceae bacterium]MBP9167071.1 hypothetical protein [Kofleriaceae bacterium]MBP9860215.1 hypothetical protein [Kofleriaceae bacterium]